MCLSRYYLIFGFLLISLPLLGQEAVVLPSSEESGEQSHEDLSLSEWKRFKSFEKKLALTQLSPPHQEDQLLAYTRDSLQILGVKLMAVKLLEEKKLLDRDILENAEYYVALLEAFRKSGISQTEYLFLEEKMAFLNQGVLEKKLQLGRWLIIALSILCGMLVLLVFRLRSRRKSTALPELSKQEATVRNLILQGKTNKEIANELFISLSTVKTHITNLYGKLNITSRQELLQKHTGTST